MSTLNSSRTINNQPIKCTLTRIEQDFVNFEPENKRSASIVKNYVYNPQKRFIA